MNYFNDFLEVVHSIRDRELLEDFLVGITTEHERAELGKRLAIVKKLLNNEPHHKIAQELGVGIATVTRGSKELSHGSFKHLRRAL